jgi:hypothetical protein
MWAGISAAIFEGSAVLPSLRWWWEQDSNL